MKIDTEIKKTIVPILIIVVMGILAYYWGISNDSKRF